MFFANPVYSERSHLSACHFQWNGRTRSLNNSVFLFEIPQFSLNNFLPLFRILKRFKKWKSSNVVFVTDLVHNVRRDTSVTLRKFSSNTAGHGLPITETSGSSTVPLKSALPDFFLSNFLNSVKAA